MYELAYDQNTTSNRPQTDEARGNMSFEQNADTQILEAVRYAMEHDRFTLFGQRIIPLASVAPEHSRVEILLRLFTESNQLITPGTFIPIAERSGLIRMLDRYVVEKVFSMLSLRLKKDGQLQESVNINVSAITVCEPDFRDYISQALAHYRLPPAYVCFEITETSRISDMNVARDFIVHLQSMGVRVALDDFGIGFASLGYFRHLPVNYLKIPGHFVQQLTSNPVDQVLVESICNMASRIGIETVAEEVENQETLEFLRSVGCSYVQGYLFHHPESWPLSRRLPQSTTVLRFPDKYATH